MTDLCSILTPILTSIQIAINQIFGVLSLFGFTPTIDLISPITSLLGCSLT